MEEIYALLLKVKETEPLLEDIKETLKIIVCPADSTFSYKDLYPYVIKPVPEEKRRIFELLNFYNFAPKLGIVKGRLELKMNKHDFFWCKRHLKVLSAGWLYLLYSEVLKMFKVGMTESTMKRRLTNYKKKEKWKELHSGFCGKLLQTKELQLKNYCASNFTIAKGDEFLELKPTQVKDVKTFIEFLCL